MGFNIRHRFSGGTAVGMGSGNSMSRFGRFMIGGPSSPSAAGPGQSFTPRSSGGEGTKKDTQPIPTRPPGAPAGAHYFGETGNGGFTSWTYPDGSEHYFNPGGQEVTGNGQPINPGNGGGNPGNGGGTPPGQTGAQSTQTPTPTGSAPQTVVEPAFGAGDVHIVGAPAAAPTQNNTLDPGAVSGPPAPTDIAGGAIPSTSITLPQNAPYYDSGSFAPPPGPDQSNPLPSSYDPNAVPNVQYGPPPGTTFNTPGSVTPNDVAPFSTGPAMPTIYQPAPVNDVAPFDSGNALPPATVASPTLSPVDSSYLDPGLVDPLSGTPVASSGGGLTGLS